MTNSEARKRMQEQLRAAHEDSASRPAHERRHTPAIDADRNAALVRENTWLREQVARAEALADEWAEKQGRNRAQYIDGPLPLPKFPSVMVETFEPVSELRAALADPTDDADQTARMVQRAYGENA